MTNQCARFAVFCNVGSGKRESEGITIVRKGMETLQHMDTFRIYMMDIFALW